jgi:hypothetical protein
VQCGCGCKVAGRHPALTARRDHIARKLLKSSGQQCVAEDRERHGLTIGQAQCKLGHGARADTAVRLAHMCQIHDSSGVERKTLYLAKQSSGGLGFASVEYSDMPNSTACLKCHKEIQNTNTYELRANQLRVPSAL